MAGDLNIIERAAIETAAPDEGKHLRRLADTRQATWGGRRSF
jgi:hypothetical protein